MTNKDLNDLYMAAGCNPAAFNDKLAALPVRTIDNTPDEAAMNEPFRPTTPVQPKKYRDLPSGFYEAIERELGVKEYKANGFSNNVHCPFHDDQRPSAGWHGEKHFLSCFVCGDIKAITVGEEIGLNWRDYIESPASNSNDGDEEAEVTFIKGNAKDKKLKPPTDDELGDQLIAAWNGDVALLYEQWYYYHPEGYWQPTDVVHRQIWDVLKLNKDRGVNPNKARVCSIEDYLHAKLRVPPDRVDQGDAYLNLQNGLLNLETLEIEPHQRELYLTSQLPFAYDPDAKCPAYDQFQRQSLTTKDGKPDQQLIDLTNEAIGYSVTTDTSHEKGFFLYGEAASGKSTLLKVIQRLLGPASWTVDFNSLDRNEYQLAHIPGKRVLICAEAKINTILSDHHIKTIISGEELLVRQIYREPFTCRPYGKLWWAMNELPQNQDRSNAIYRRLIIIPFNNPVPEDRRDRQLVNKLLAELPGILNLALQGLQRLREQGDFTRVDQVEALVQDYKDASDVEANFVNDAEYCILDEALATPLSELYDAYKAWCERFGYKPKSHRVVGRDWERLGLVKYKNNTMWYRGIGLTEEAQDIVKHVNILKGGKKHPMS